MKIIIIIIHFLSSILCCWVAHLAEIFDGDKLPALLLCSLLLVVVVLQLHCVISIWLRFVLFYTDLYGEEY